jgi:hypothetical protein
MDALLAHFKAQCGTLFATYSRRFIDFEQLANILSTNPSAPDIPSFPALYLYDGGTNAETWVSTGRRGLPSKRYMRRHVIIYARRAGAGTPDGPIFSAGGPVIHPLIEAVEVAIEAPSVQPGGDAVSNITLGGLVYDMVLEGQGILIPGDLDPSGLCMVTIPIRMTLP